MEEKKNMPQWGMGDAQDMARQLMRNYDEDCGFADILEGFLRHEYEGAGPIPVCKTPNVLLFGGAKPGLDVVINPSTIRKCMAKPEERFGESCGHDLDKETLRFLVFALRNPVMLLKGSQPDSLVAVTDLIDKEGRPIIVPVALNRRNAWHPVAQIVSVYGRNNFDAYLQNQINKGNLLAINRNKANQMLRSTGVQFPVEESLISFDNSIAYTLENVKVISTKNLSQNLGEKNVVDDVLKDATRRSSAGYSGYGEAEMSLDYE